MSFANRLFLQFCNIYYPYLLGKTFNCFLKITFKIFLSIDLLSPIHFSMSAFWVFFMNTHQKILSIKYPFVGIH